MPPDLLERLRGVGLSGWEAVLACAVVALFWMIIALHRRNRRDREEYHAETRKQLVKTQERLEELENQLSSFYACPHFSCPMRRQKIGS